MADKTPDPRKTVIAVCGQGFYDKEICDLAYEVGREIAKAGAVMVCGGLGGVMESAARGAYDEGGDTIGILPGPDTAAANPWIKYAVATEMGQARNAIIISTADAVIAVGGAYGTLSEIAFALKAGKTVVSLKSWEKGLEVTKADKPAKAVKIIMESLEGS